MKIPLIKPFINDDIKKRVLAVLDSGHLTEGPVTREFEESCRAYLGCKYCIAVTSCTVGLEVALRCLGVGKGDEVIVPDYTYPATADVVRLVGAKTVLVDVDPTTMLIDYDALVAAITPETKAILPVSLFGNPLDYDRLAAIKDKYGIFIIEDAACSLGSEYKGRKVGAIGDMAAFFLSLGTFMFVALITRKRSWFYPPAVLLGLTAVCRILAWLIHDAALAIPFIALEAIVACLLLVAARSLALED